MEFFDERFDNHLLQFKLKKQKTTKKTKGEKKKEEKENWRKEKEKRQTKSKEQRNRNERFFYSFELFIYKQKRNGEKKENMYHFQFLPHHVNHYFDMVKLLSFFLPYRVSYKHKILLHLKKKLVFLICCFFCYFLFSCRSLFFLMKLKVCSLWNFPLLFSFFSLFPFIHFFLHSSFSFWASFVISVILFTDKTGRMTR